jgi:hypothetical protein
MPINQITPIGSIQNYLREQIERREKAIIKTLLYVGEQCVNKAREKGGYNDQTGNLRSSVGYILVKGGNIINVSDFKQEKNGTEGTKDGLSFAKQKAREYNTGIVLIVVAGMNYASCVASNGYDVLDSAELYADTSICNLLTKLGLK